MLFESVVDIKDGVKFWRLFRWITSDVSDIDDNSNVIDGIRVGNILYFVDRGFNIVKVRTVR